MMGAQLHTIMRKREAETTERGALDTMKTKEGNRRETSGVMRDSDIHPAQVADTICVSPASEDL